jgi:hypothetical protein
LRRIRLALPLIGIAALAAAAGASRAAHAQRHNPFDPFRPAPASQPARLAGAAVPSSQPARVTLLAAASQPAATSQPAAPAKQKAARPAAAAGAACLAEADCGPGSVCEGETCHPIRFRTNIAYLYYRSVGRSFTEAGALYWHQRGRSGYRVLAPFYWHFWRPTNKLQAVFPVWWHWIDHQAHTESTVVPPIQWGKAPGEKYFRFWPLLFYADYGKAGSSFTLAPLVHFARRGKYASGGVFPFAFHSRDEQKQTSFTWVAPLNFHWRKADKKGFLSIPFAFYHGSRRSSLAVIPAPPIVYYRNKDWSLATLFPIYWRVGTPKDRESTIFPLVWYGHSGKSKHAVVFPIFWHFSRPQGHTTVLAPLAYFGSDRKRGTSHATVLPLFHYSTSSFGRKAFLLTPLFVHETDRDASSSYTFLFAPPYYRHRDPDREVDALIPLYLRYKNLETGSTIHAVTPLIWFRSDPEGKTQILFPAVWRFTNKRKHLTATVVPPIFFHSSAPGRSTTVLTTAFFRRDERNWSAGVAPVLFFGGGRDGRHAVIFPWLWHFSNATTSTTIAAPFFHRRDARGWSAGLAPVIMAGSRGGERHFVLFPLVWHFASARERSNITVVGPAYGGTTRRGWRAGLAPVLFFGRDGPKSHQIVAPLFWRSADTRRGDETIVVGPGFWRVQGAGRPGSTTSYGLLPLFHYSHTTAPRESTSLTVVPLFHHSRSARRDLWVTPLGGLSKTRDRETLVVGPYVHHRSPNRDGHYLAPLFGHWRDRDGTTTDMLLPLGVYSRGPQKTAAVLFPLLWYFRSKTETDLTVFPFYSRVRSDDLNADVAFPLVWSFRSSVRRTLIVLPGYHSRGLKRDSLDTGILPLFVYSRSPERRIFASLPFVYLQSWSKQKRTLQVVGPFWRATYADGYNTGLFPLGFIRDRGPARQAMLFPIFWHSTDSKADAHRNILVPFYYHRYGNERLYGVLPALWLKTKPHGAAVTVFPAFHVANDIERVRVLTAAFGFQYGRGVKPSWAYVGPLWWLRKPKEQYSSDGIFPLLWRFHDKVRERHTFMLAPIWYSRVAPDAAFYAFVPFVWRNRTVDSSTTVVFPFYYDVHRYYAERTTVVVPFALRRYTTDDNTTTWATLPSIMVRKRPDATDAFVFPFLWHWGGDRRSTTVVAPLYWDFKRGDERTTILAPLVWRFKRATADTWVVLNTYYRKGLGKDAGTYRLIFVPLFEVARPRAGDLTWDVLGGLVGYARLGMNRVLKLFWKPIWLSAKPKARLEPGASQRVTRQKPGQPASD